MAIATIELVSAPPPRTPRRSIRTVAIAAVAKRTVEFRARLSSATQMPPEPTPDPATGPADANTEARRSLRDRTSFTRLLSRVAAGDRSDLDRLLEVVYEELRRLAQVHLRGERADHTLAATALVHEAYVRLVDQREVAWQDRAHFFAAASRIIRRILVDHARARHALKRGGRRAGDAGRIELDALESPEDGIDVIELEDALTRLAEIDERQARIVELRYFGGLTIDQIAEVLDLGARTVDRDWRCARTWLYEALRPGDDDPHEERSARRRGDDV